MSRARSLPIAALLLAAVLATAGCAGGGSASAATAPSDESLARAAASAFLDRYLEADGRVVRRDQGGDTVSEGQSYAMLLTAATGDEARFTSIWSWTKANLQRPDGLLSWSWHDGRISDPQPATDADLDAAQALVLAGRRFSQPQLTADGQRIGRAVLAGETATDGQGRRLLVAGPWAVSGEIVNPSYFSPRAYSALAATGDEPAWHALHEQALSSTADLLSQSPLPPDWARAQSALHAQAIASPGGAAGPPSYGFDAARVAIRMGSACDSASRAVAARLWPVLSGGDDQLLPRRLDGAADGGAVRNPVALVGAAGAAKAAGRPADVSRLLDAAAAQDRSTPTYYGAAWVALGRVLLTTDLAGRCA
ncbi:MAG TPA: glycosyl hydrolase family 8 [Solirubrobacteraceae bacterium]|jgi:endoglucanase|nr:glycosyl hydrolase family 8 [Solirubrobacteraceae bacterium]